MLQKLPKVRLWGWISFLTGMKYFFISVQNLSMLDFYWRWLLELVWLEWLLESGSQISSNWAVIQNFAVMCQHFCRETIPSDRIREGFQKRGGEAFHPYNWIYHPI